MLKLAEHEIFSGHICLNVNNYCHFNIYEQEQQPYRLIWARKSFFYTLYLWAFRISCLAELSMKNFNDLGPALKTKLKSKQNDT